MTKTLTLFFVVASVISCVVISKEDRELVANHDRIVERAIEGIEVFSHFKRCFPQSAHFISYVTGKDGQPTWHSVAKLLNRYVLKMNVSVNVDRTTLNLMLREVPTFRVFEVERIENLPDGRLSVFYGQTYEIGAATWKRFVDSRCDLEKLEIPLKKDAPVSQFDKFRGY
jgi:hypothetical protein